MRIEKEMLRMVDGDTSLRKLRSKPEIDTRAEDHA